MSHLICSRPSFDWRSAFSFHRPPERCLGSSHDADAFLKSRWITSSIFQDMFRDTVLLHWSRGCLGQPSWLDDASHNITIIDIGQQDWIMSFIAVHWQGLCFPASIGVQCLVCRNCSGATCLYSCDIRLEGHHSPKSLFWMRTLSNLISSQYHQNLKMHLQNGWLRTDITSCPFEQKLKSYTSIYFSVFLCTIYVCAFAPSGRSVLPKVLQELGERFFTTYGFIWYFQGTKRLLANDRRWVQHELYWLQLQQIEYNWVT